MHMATATRYISANLTPDAANELRSLTASMTISEGRRVTTSDLITALIKLGRANHAELAAHLQPPARTKGGG
jgi:hypothetical protein